ncbi:MAG: hypothetical protein M1824_006174 [Vezdaea acicularis]|nr:MAG: hypothetical protein M1824_006174 [Vezdaea acicularis]
MFDEVHTSRPFLISDSFGIDVTVSGTHAYYASNTAPSFLKLTPGDNFTREFNIYDFIPPSRLSGGSRMFTVNLPSELTGFIGNEISGSQSVYRIGSISLESAPLTITLPQSAPKQHDLLRRQAGGVPSTRDWNGYKAFNCNGTKLSSLNTAIAGVGQIASAAKNAASQNYSFPFSYFFRAQDAEMVMGIMGNLNAASQGQGPAIAVTCDDVVEHCGSAVGLMAYVPSANSGLNFMSICPAAFDAGSAEHQLSMALNTPCQDQPGTVRTLSSTLLHESLHLRDLWPIVVGDYAYGAVPAHNLLTDGQDPTINADSYAVLADFSWTLGFGSWSPPPGESGGSCVSKWGVPDGASSTPSPAASTSSLASSSSSSIAFDSASSTPTSTPTPSPVVASVTPQANPPVYIPTNSPSSTPGGILKLGSGSISAWLGSLWHGG